MSVTDALLASLPSALVGTRDVCVGPFWTLVWTDRGAGLASTQGSVHQGHERSPVRWAGDLLQHTAQELAQLLYSDSPIEASIGMATVNSLLPLVEARLTDRNASQEIVRRGDGKRVVVVGHFPFLSEVRRTASCLHVLELHPQTNELPASAAGEVVPEADVVAITGTSLLNRTFDGLIALCRPDAFVLVLGPTTPLSPVLFDHHVDMIAGTLVVDPLAAIKTAVQGASFQQMRGVRLVTMARDR